MIYDAGNPDHYNNDVVVKAAREPIQHIIYVGINKYIGTNRYAICIKYISCSYIKLVYIFCIIDYYKNCNIMIYYFLFRLILHVTTTSCYLETCIHYLQR